MPIPSGFGFQSSISWRGRFSASLSGLKSSLFCPPSFPTTRFGVFGHGYSHECLLVGCEKSRHHHLPNSFLRCLSLMLMPYNAFVMRGFTTRTNNSSSLALKMVRGVVRFDVGDHPSAEMEKISRAEKKARISRKKKLNELRFYRLKAKKKLKSPNPEVRIRYKLEKAKRKEAWLIEKIRKYDVPKAAPETFDPEMLTEEERFYLKRTGEKKKHYVPVGRRGVFGGVVLNMHLHWKRHETVKVICKPCKPGQVHEFAEELARLSRGIIIHINPNNTIIFYRGKNYVRPDVMSPPDTLSKTKALEKYRYEQSLEHTSQFIEKLEDELQEYLHHLARYKNQKMSMQEAAVFTQ